MVNDKIYVKTLKHIISCVSHGDYYSAKELSMLELDKMKKKEIKIRKNIRNLKYKIKFKGKKNKLIKDLDRKNLEKIVSKYSEYMLGIINKADNINQIKEEAISIYDFIRKTNYRKTIKKY